MESAESTPSLGRQPRNTFETRGNVSNQAGEQNIYGNVVFQSVWHRTLDLHLSRFWCDILEL